MRYFTTENTTVDAVGEINFSGNITPQIWYKTIITEKGKPHYLAISILSDIVYWYRPTEVRDERSGSVVGWKKRFSDDLLQRSYDYFSDMYGESKKTITRAILLLEELGVITRVFRSIKTANGMVLNNVLYIDLNVEKLTELTYPQKETVIHNEKKMQEYRKREQEQPASPVNKPMDKSVDPYGQICREGMDKSGERVWTDLSRPMDKNGETLPTDLVRPLPSDVQTNTEITTENTTENTNRDYYNHINLSAEEQKTDSIDGMDETQAYMKLIKKNIEYDHYRQYGTWNQKQMIEELYDMICDVVCVKRKEIRVGKEDYPYEIVKSRFLKITASHIEYVISCMEKQTDKISNIKAYLITTLYNAPSTMHHYYQQEVQHDMYGGGWHEKGIE